VYKCVDGWQRKNPLYYSPRSADNHQRIVAGAWLAQLSLGKAANPSLEKHHTQMGISRQILLKKSQMD